MWTLRLYDSVILCSFSTRASPRTWKPTCSFYVNNNKAQSPSVPRLVWILRDLCNNFHALPCRQSVPQYQLQQESNLASSKTKVCIRVKQLFTLFELQYLTHGTLCAWSFASFSLNLWQRVRWITKSFSPILPSPVVLFSVFHLFLHLHPPPTTPPPLPPPPFFPFALPLELFIISFKVSASTKLMVTHKLHYVFSLPLFFFYKLTALLISL